ncbi:MAG: Gfo/Idh/MocA family oxidoreductase [Fimbriimonadaceae bacterium]|nr:Gfo/Idh/MocA family oxidoreductase [Fimbriimonadaceae bacterium]
MRKTAVGIVGCGNISGIYLQNLTGFAQTRVAAVADLDLDRAKAKAAEHGVPKAYGLDDILADPEVEIILNITVPDAHHEVAMKAVSAGKHVYNEKPLTVERAEAQELLAAAEAKGVRVGCAPDTVLGAGVQTARELIDRGEIGRVVSAQAWMMGAGPEGWHPNPTFYYAKGGGPLYDMGPYYLSALMTLVGPVARVTGSAQTTFAERTASSAGNEGKKIPVMTPTLIHSVLEFEGGPVAQLTTSFDTMADPGYPHIDIFGSEGMVRVPDPNGFGGPVLLKKKGADSFTEVEVRRPYAENSRGVGVLDMALAIQSGRPHRANGQMAAHLLDVMHAVHESSTQGRHIVPVVHATRPDAMPDTELDA